MPAWFYILRLRSGQLYVGATTDLERRWQEHVNGVACCTSEADPSVAIVYREEYSSFPEARRREAQVKRWSRAKREALVAGDATALRRLAISHDHRKCAASAPARQRPHDSLSATPEPAAGTARNTPKAPDLSLPLRPEGRSS